MQTKFSRSLGETLGWLPKECPVACVAFGTQSVCVWGGGGAGKSRERGETMEAWKSKERVLIYDFKFKN